MLESNRSESSALLSLDKVCFESVGVSSKETIGATVLFFCAYP
jgi:hypothetical protein